MDLNEFYKQVEGIIIFPGSVDDLNRVEEKAVSGNKYELFPVTGGNKFISGVIVPSKEELKAQLAVMSGIFAGIAELQGEEAEGAKKELDEMLESQLEPFLHKMLGSPALMSLDLRLKAKQLGADGIVHVQMYDKNGRHFGVPVKLVNEPEYLGGR